MSGVALTPCRPRVGPDLSRPPRQRSGPLASSGALSVLLCAACGCVSKAVRGPDLGIPHASVRASPACKRNAGYEMRCVPARHPITAATGLAKGMSPFAPRARQLLHFYTLLASRAADLQITATINVAPLANCLSIGVLTTALSRHLSRNCFAADHCQMHVLQHGTC